METVLHRPGADNEGNLTRADQGSAPPEQKSVPHQPWAADISDFQERSPDANIALVERPFWASMPVFEPAWKPPGMAAWQGWSPAPQMTSPQN